MGATVSSAFVCEIRCLSPLYLNLPFTLLEPQWLMPPVSQEEPVSASLFSLLRMGWAILTVGAARWPLELGMLSDNHEQKKTIISSEELCLPVRAAGRKIVSLPWFAWDVCYSRNLHGCCIHSHRLCSARLREASFE